MMSCPTCTNDTRVTNSRQTANNEIYRRRECASCGYRFSTTERANRQAGDARKQAGPNREVKELLTRVMSIMDDDEKRSGTVDTYPRT